MTSHDATDGPTQRPTPPGRARGDTLPKALTRLRGSASGVGFIYEALDLVASRFGLDDIAVVFEDELVGTQIFRLGGGSVSPDRIELVSAAPGVYCDPSLVSTRDKNVLYRACREELATTGHRQRSPIGEPASFDVAHGAPASDVELRARDVDLAGDELVASTPRPVVVNIRRAISQLFVVVDVATIALVVLDVHGPIRFLFGLIVGVAIPGWSIVGLVKFENAPLEIALTMTVSFAIVMASAQLLMFVQWWHLAGFEVIVCLICLPSLLWQARRPPAAVRSRL